MSITSVVSTSQPGRVSTKHFHTERTYPVSRLDTILALPAQAMGIGGDENDRLLAFVHCVDCLYGRAHHDMLVPETLR